MKTTLIIITWLLLLTIFILRIHGQMKERPTNSELLTIDIRLDLLESNDLAQMKKTVMNYVINRAEEKVDSLLRNRHVVPVGNGILLAVENPTSTPSVLEKQDHPR